MHTVWNGDSNYVQQPRIVTIKRRFSFRRTKKKKKKKARPYICIHKLDTDKIRKNNNNEINLSRAFTG